MLQRKHKITQHIFHKVSSTFQKYKHILNIKHTKMTEANKIRRMKEATQPNFKRWTEVTKCRIIHTEGWREATQPTFNRWTQVTKCRRIHTEGWKEKSHNNRSYQVQKLSNRRLKINIQRLHKIQWKNCKLSKLLSSFF